MPHTFAHIGQELRHRRAERGDSLAHISNTTRIPMAYLNAIEKLDKDNLPSMSYALGYVRTYAKHMGLAGDFAAERFKADLEISHIAVHKGPKKSIKSRPIALPKGIFSGLAVSLFAGSLAMWFGVHADDQAEIGLLVPVEQTYEVRKKAVLPVDIYRITAQGPSLIELRSRDGETILRRILTPGQTWEGPAQAGITLSARNGSALTLERGTENYGPLTQFGAALPQISLSALELRLTGPILPEGDLSADNSPAELTATQIRRADIALAHDIAEDSAHR